MDKGEIFNALERQNKRVKELEKAIAIYVREQCGSQIFYSDIDAISWFIKEQSQFDD